jgi:hypothetical protein
MEVRAAIFVNADHFAVEYGVPLQPCSIFDDAGVAFCPVRRVYRVEAPAPRPPMHLEPVAVVFHFVDPNLDSGRVFRERLGPEAWKKPGGASLDRTWALRVRHNIRAAYRPLTADSWQPLRQSQSGRKGPRC